MMDVTVKPNNRDEENIFVANNRVTECGYSIFIVVEKNLMV